MRKAITILLAGVLLLIMAGCSSTFEWPESTVASVIPKPASKNGKIHSSSNEELRLDVEGASLGDYNEYIKACKESGFTVESIEDGSSYEAFNQEGYKLSVHYYDGMEELSIDAKAPEKLETLTWPTSGLATKLPAIDSSVGRIVWDNSGSFRVVVGEMPREEYESYIQACEKAGFTLDHSKGDTYYSAKHKDGYSVRVDYAGFSVVEISISLDEDDDEEDVTTEEKTTATTTAKTTEADSDDTSWREFIADYEAWVDDYVEFMKKYQDDPTDLSLLADYADMMSEMIEWSEKADEISDEMSVSDAAEYAKALARINEKLASVLE